MIQANQGIEQPQKFKNYNYIREDGLIYSAWVGDQNAATVKQMEEDLIALINILKKRRKKAYILSDLTALGKAPLVARQMGFKLIRNIGFEKCAMFGNFFKIGKLVNAVIIASGCGFKMRFFMDEGEATEWLRAIAE